MKRNFLLAMLCLITKTTLIAQPTQHETSLLWKVVGKDLSKPSYLFGTYHFLSHSFVDTMPAVKEAYKAAEVVVGELVMDSSLQAPMMEAALLKGTTLKKVLPDTVYAKAAGWFTREAGMDLEKLNALNPLSVMTFAMAIAQQKYFPNKPGEVQLDTYFQIMAKKDGKKIMGLETIQTQINALFGQMNLQRQASLLYDALREEDRLKNQIDVMNKAYTSQNLSALQDLMYGGAYEPGELKILLDDRNNNWMEQLPKLMKQEAAFVAVGALHLTGQTGLVEQLRKMGYTVTPLNLMQH